MHSSAHPRSCLWSFLGRRAYQQADTLQRQLRRRLLDRGSTDFLLLLEHPPVYTLGRNASERDILIDRDRLCDRGIEVVRTDRGGKVTYHGPGQLVGYPIVDLSPDRRDLRRYMGDLQAVLVAVLDDLGVEAEARHHSDEIGVWVGGRKIASLGVHVSRWVTTHGFALNVTTDLSYFGGIVACGLAGVDMTSVAAETGLEPDLDAVAALCARRFGAVFERRMMPVQPGDLGDRWPIAS